jgi:hypothetical protein
MDSDPAFDTPSCERCEVCAECLEAAMSDPAMQCVWGGVSEKGRRRLRKVAA